MHRTHPTRVVLSLAISLLLASLLGLAPLGCSDAGSPSATSEPAASASTDAAARADAPRAQKAIAHDEGEVVLAKSEHEHPRRNERPLPAFGGRTLDGQTLQIGDLIGRRLLVFFFNPEAKGVRPVAQAVARVAKESAANNFQVVGVAIGSTRTKAREFASVEGFDFPVIDDSNATITQQLNLRAPMLLLGVDGEGYVSFLLGNFPTQSPDASRVVEDMIREKLRMPLTTDALSGEVERGPEAPLFEVEGIVDGEPLRLAELRGKPVVLIFFLHTCPHCHKALEFFKSALAGIEEDKRPVLVGVSLRNQPSAVRRAMQEADLDFFPIMVDPTEKAVQDYGVFGGVPDIFVIDKQGKIVRHVQGWREDRDPALMRMVLAREAGTRIPMLLNKNGYTGNDVCSVCHEAQEAAWEFTAHSTAFATLVKHGASTKPDCVGCHVVGFDEPGGYSIAQPQEHLENVGCEDCHGRGGPHLSPGLVKDGDYENVCKTCHNPKHSLGFDYETFLPKVSHAAILSMTPAQREVLVKGHGGPRDLLPTKADYVGSDACQSCHEKEFEIWSAGGHGHALDSLEAKGKADDQDCLVCHTTAYGRKGGFPKGGVPAEHPDLARVGCESCHGPGGNHIGPQAERFGTIVSLGDKCDSCVILKICGSCHDEANDPGFTFEVEEKIERQRHGTTEPGTGKPIAEGPDTPARVAADVARVLALQEPS